jgi:hypothetical protein
MLMQFSSSNEIILIRTMRNRKWVVFQGTCNLASKNNSFLSCGWVSHFLQKIIELLWFSFLPAGTLIKYLMKIFCNFPISAFSRYCLFVSNVVLMTVHPIHILRKKKNKNVFSAFSLSTIVLYDILFPCSFTSFSLLLWYSQCTSLR